METVTYLQPREGIAGSLRDQDDLLSLDEAALPRRLQMAAMIYQLYDACLVGNPAPTVAEKYVRISKPQVGDLVVETSRIYRNYMDVEAFGILIDHRDEWWDTDEEYQRQVAAGEVYADEPRSVDHAWYVQYGPQPEDVCRWVNCSFIAALTSLPRT